MSFGPVCVSQDGHAQCGHIYSIFPSLPMKSSVGGVGGLCYFISFMCDGGGLTINNKNHGSVPKFAFFFWNSYEFWE